MAARLKTILAAAAFAALAACSQNPLFRMNMANRAYSSLDELYVLLASADLGALRSASSYAGEVEHYAEIIGGFEVSRLLAADHRADSVFASSLDATIGQCVDQIRRLADMHRSTGIAPRSPLIRTVRTACDAAARSVSAFEASSWVFSTVAGDL